jgi:hypothetical protein
MPQTLGNPEDVGIDIEHRGFIVTTPSALSGGNEFGHPE